MRDSLLERAKDLGLRYRFSNYFKSSLHKLDVFTHLMMDDERFIKLLNLGKSARL